MVADLQLKGLVCVMELWVNDCFTELTFLFCVMVNIMFQTVAMSKAIPSTFPQPIISNSFQKRPRIDLA